MRQAAIQLHIEAGVDRSGPWGRDSFAKFQTALKPNQLYVWSPAPPPERPILIYRGDEHEGGQPIHLLATGREEVEDSQEEGEDSQEEVQEPVTGTCYRKLEVRKVKPDQGRWGHYDVITGDPAVYFGFTYFDPRSVVVQY